MRITVKAGISAALLWIIFKLTLYFIGFSDGTTILAVLTNIFMLLSAISIGLYLQKRMDTEETNAMVDLKNAMSAGVLYTLITSLFLFFFYSKINPGYYAKKIAEKEFEIHQMVSDSVQLENFKKEFPDAEVMTKEQIEKKLIENNKKGASVGFTSTLTILAMLLLSTFYSIMITIIYRRIVFKN